MYISKEACGYYQCQGLVSVAGEGLLSPGFGRPALRCQYIRTSELAVRRSLVQPKMFLSVLCFEVFDLIARARSGRAQRVVPRFVDASISVVQYLWRQKPASDFSAQSRDADDCRLFGRQHAHGSSLRPYTSWRRAMTRGAEGFYDKMVRAGVVKRSSIPTGLSLRRHKKCGID